MTAPRIPLTPDDDAYKTWLAARQQQPAPDASAPRVPITHDDAAFQAWKAQQANTTGEKSPPPRSTLYNALNTVDNALTFGLGQKFNAAWNAAGDAMKGRDSFAHSYTQNLDAEHAGLEAFRKQHPYGAAAAGAVGAAGQVAAAAPLIAAGAAGEVANGMTLAQRAAAAARTGGALGSVNALGNAPNRGGVVDQLATAGKGGVAGATLGAAAVPASEGIATLVRKAPEVLAKVAPDALTAPAATRITKDAAAIAGAQPTRGIDPATRLMLRRLERTGMTPQQAIDALAQIPADKPVSIMEIAGDQSHPLRQLGKWVARTPSTGSSQLRSAIAQRAEPLPNAQRVLGDVSDALGVARTNLVDNAATLRGQQLANATPHYDAAFGEATAPVPITSRVNDGPTLGDLLKRPSIKNAVKFHNDLAAERGEPSIDLSGEARPKVPPGFTPEQWDAAIAAMRKAGISPPAEAMETPTVPLKTLQLLKFKLDDALGFAKRSGTLPDGTPATNAKLGAINDTRRALLDIMTQHSPEYAAGNTQWAGDAAVQEAAEQGQAFLSRPISELQASLPKLSPGERSQHNVAAVSGPLRDRVFNTSAVDRAKIFNNPDIQERLSTAAPADALDALRKRLGVEHQIALTNQQVLGGSDTAENLQNAADIEGQAVKSILSGLATGRTRRALSTTARGVISPVVDNLVHGINERSANALAPKLIAGMQSRADLQSFLDELATALDQMQRTRTSLPYAGASMGVTVGPASSRDRLR